MKKSDYFMILILGFVVMLLTYATGTKVDEFTGAISKLNATLQIVQMDIEDIRNNYVSYDELQPVLDDCAEYQTEVDGIRNNLNDWNALWKQLFGYEQRQYMMRGR